MLPLLMDVCPTGQRLFELEAIVPICYLMKMTNNDSKLSIRTAYKVLALFMALCLCGPAAAFTGDPRFGHLGVGDGLSQGVVLSIFQDSQGFMWISTEDGLNKYDGYDFTVYKHEPDNPNSLSSSHVWGVNE
jgi:hypothetical protein